MNKTIRLSELREKIRTNNTEIRHFRLYPTTLKNHVMVKYQEACYCSMGGYKYRTWLDRSYPSLLAD